MHLSEETLTVIGSALVPVLGLVAFLVRLYVHSKNERIKELLDDRQSLEAKLATAEARGKVAEVKQDEADERRDKMERSLSPLMKENLRLQAEVKRLEDLAEKYRQDADKYYTAGQKEHQKRKDLEARAEKAESEAKVAQQAFLDAEKQAKNREAILQSKLSAEVANRTQAQAAAVKACAERDALGVQLTEAKKNADELRRELERYEAQIDVIAKQDGRVWEGPTRPNAPEFKSLTKRGTESKDGTPVISLLNLKGGVGKTTIAGNLAGYLDEYLEQRVLLIDLDHQRSLSQLLLSAKERERAAAAHTIQRFLRSEQKSGQLLFDCSWPVPGLTRCRLITNADPKEKTGANPGLDDLEMRLMSEWLVKPSVPDARLLLREAVQSEIIRDQFDYVLIDCPPRLTTACINALAASDFLLIPCQTEAVSLASVEHLLQRLRLLRDCDLLRDLRILGILPNMVPPTGFNDDSPEREALTQVRKISKDKDIWGATVHVFKTMLRRDENYAKASRFLRTELDLRLGIYYAAVQRDFNDLTTEIQQRIKNESRDVAGVPA